MAIFEQIGKRISNAGQGAAQQAKNFADITRLNGMISEKEKRISQIYIEIGQSYYARHKSDAQAEELDRINAINSLSAEILQCREDIKQIKGVTKCPNCGADVPLNAAFCNACGAKVLPVEKSREVVGTVETLSCPNCHMPVPAGNSFCNHCGTKIDKTDE